MKELLKPHHFVKIIGILFVIGFVLRFGADVFKIELGLHSAPLVLLLAERSGEFLLPGLACFIASPLIIRYSREDS